MTILVFTRLVKRKITYMSEKKRGKWEIKTTFQRKLWDLIDKVAGGKWTVFADMGKIAHSTFTNYLAGKSEPKREALDKICEAGKVNASYFDDANKTGIDYVMKAPKVSHMGDQPGSKDYGPSSTDILLSKAREVLESGTHYGASLAANINSFYEAVREKRMIEKRLNTLEEAREAYHPKKRKAKQGM